MDRSDVSVTLDAVIVAVTDDRPRILTVVVDRGVGIPSGPLDPVADKTLERALRRWITELTGLRIGYAEQLYTFGDRDRHATADDPRHRRLSVAYLALVREETPAEGAAWRDWYGFFPWEDHRRGRPPVIDDVLLPGLAAWAAAGGDMRGQREARIAETLHSDGGWDGIRVLERYELLYEAKLVPEAFVDAGREPPPGVAGDPMVLDHRRMVASAVGRLRGKLTYRPVVFELLPERFTLGALQQTVEALAGVRLHTQNFRRLMERNRLVEGTGERTTATGGRPAELFRFRPEVQAERPRTGIGVPYR